MIYRDFQGEKLSALGFGTMRLPVLEGDYGKVDEKKAAEMFDYAISHGVNYFDTAWGYHDGESENVVGRILSSYPRESKSSSKNAEPTISTFICSTMSAR